MARDNTVKYQWCTLQLLPGTEHPSYTGVQVEVLEHTDGRLQVRHEGEIIPTRPAPPTIRCTARFPWISGSHSGNRPHCETPGQPPPQPTSVAKPGQPRARSHVVEDDDEDNDHIGNTVSEPQALEERPLSPRQLALWRAVQEAKVQGISLREIARQLGVSRNTVRKYARALTQPTNRPHNRGARRLPQLAAKR